MYLGEITCPVCGHTGLEDVNSFNRNKMCATCCKEVKDKARRVHLAGLKGLSVEERLARLEEIQYDTANQPPKNIIYS